MNLQYLSKFIIFCALGISITVVNINCATTESGNEEANYQSAYSAAEKSQKQAKQIGNEWRDTKKLLEKSKKAAASGDYSKATALANEARQQYEMAVAQVNFNEENLKNTPFYDPDATPEQDIKKIQGFFREKFPNLPDQEFANGFYAMDPVMRVNWEAIEEFPPYEPAIEEGEVLWNTPFQNGKSYSDCFTGPDIMTNYPHWNSESGEVETLPMALNECRKANGEKPLKYGKTDMVALQAYVAFQSRGNPTNVQVPPDDPRALEAYKEGKKFYFSRRGQLNLACYHCHFYNAGNWIRANVLGPALGQTTHWPTYRSKWGDIGTLHRRYKGCNKQVRAKPFDLQSKEYRNLEYFHTFLSNGIPTNGPGARF